MPRRSPILLVPIVLWGLLLTSCGSRVERPQGTSPDYHSGDGIQEGRPTEGTKDLALPKGVFLQDRGGPGRLGHVPGAGPEFPARSLWTRSELGLIRTAPLADGERIFVLSSAGRLSCLNREDGEILWSLSLSSPTLSSPALGEEEIFVLDGRGTLYSFSVYDGRELWKQDTGEGTSLSLLLMDGLVLAAGNRGRIRAFRTRDGEVLWEGDLKLPLYAAPSGREGRIFIAGESGTVTALSLEDGRELWKNNLPGSVLAPLIPAREGLFGVLAGPVEGAYVLLDQKTGELLWHWPLQTPILAPAAVDGGNAYFADMGGSLFSVRLDSGIIRWRRRIYGPVSSGLFLADRRVLATTEDGILYRLEGDSGEISGRAVLPPAVSGPPLILDGTVYLGTLRRGFHALGGSAEGDQEHYTSLPEEPILAPILDPDRDLEVFLPREGLLIHLPALQGPHYIGLVGEGHRPVTLKLLDPEGSVLAENLGYTQLEKGFEYRFDEKKTYLLMAEPVQLESGLSSARLRLQSVTGKS